MDWPIEAGLGEEFLARVNEHRKTRKRRKRTVAKGAALGVACLLVAAWAIPYFRDTAVIETPPTQRTVVVLPDGSTVQLNAHTEIHTDFRYGRRRIEIAAGEAYFAVAKDPSHPFVVRTPEGTVRVTGTHFNVRLDLSRAAEVTLFEGAVTFDGSSGDPVHLVPGQQVTSSSRHIRALTPAEQEDVLAWRKGRIVFDGLTLAQVAERLAVYHGKEIVVAPEIGSLRPGGSFPIDNLPAVLDALGGALSVRVHETSTGLYQIVPR